MSQPATFGQAVRAQATMEARLTARRGENLLAMIGLPAAALLFFGLVGTPAGRDATVLLPAVLALAIVATGLVNLGIATAYERGYGVLKRLGGSPLGREGLLAAKLAVVASIAVAQVVVLLALAWVVLGWRPGPDGSAIGLVVAVGMTTLVGAAAFAGLGLLIAGTVRPEAALVLANALFLVALMVGGVLVPVQELPGPLASIAGLLPVGALAEAFRASLGSGGSLAINLGIVAAWGVAALVGASRTFRWE
ncbi:MAG TPA: ABC transporter permease [Candidatus Limnocylindrales bacterium]|nr:ABC transporter permease [Candidatus Limnocylindrales bacterium]